MLSYPRLGQQVRVHYRAAAAACFRLLGRLGVVTIRSRGPGPRNHGVVIDGVMHVIPAGNLCAPFVGATIRSQVRAPRPLVAPTPATPPPPPA